jgi:hypothetical protein
MIMTKQEVFTKVITHLRKQGTKSMLPNGVCVYRSPEGLMCAAGALIEDEHYKSAFENVGCDNPQIVEALTASGVPEDAIGLVRALQTIHDEEPVGAWELCFSRLARIHHLEVPKCPATA